MARSLYGGRGGDFVVSSTGTPMPGDTGTVWTARTGGTQVVDLLDADGDPLAATGVIVAGASGQVLFQGPDGYSGGLWVQFDATAPRVLVETTTPAGTAGVFDVSAYGAIGDGLTDDSTAVAAAITAAHGAGGGTVLFPPGTYRINSQLVIPNTAGQGTTIRLTGAGIPSDEGDLGGTVLDLRYAGTVGKIVAYGYGLLELDHLALVDNGSSSLPFVYVTKTVLRAHDLYVRGNTTKTVTTVDQDVFVLGGTTTGITAHDATDAFQGYGTVIERVTAAHTRRLVYGRVYANAVVVRENVVLPSCGRGAAGTPAIEFDCNNVGFSRGNIISDNLIEMAGYAYGIGLGYSSVNHLSANQFFDSDAANVADIHVGANSIDNLIIFSGEKASPLPYKVETGGSAVAIYRGEIDGLTVASKSPTGAALIVKANLTADGGQSGDVLQIKNEADAVGWRVGGNGALYSDGNLGYVIPLNVTTNSDTAWHGAALIYNAHAGAGGVRIGPADGGQLALVDTSGATVARVFSAAGSPEGAVTAPVGSLFLRTDGGVGTTLYVKQTGTGNTGWAGK